MKILFFLSIGLDRQATSGHLLIAVIKALCEDGHLVHIIQKNTGGELPAIPKELSKYEVTTECVPFQTVKKDNFVARYLNELDYVRKSKQSITSEFDAVFIQSTTVAGMAVHAIRHMLPKATITFNVQDIFPYNLMYAGRMKKKSFLFKILASIQRYGYKHSDHIITISEDMKETLVEDGVSPDKIEVIYNWSYQDEPYENVDLTPVSHMFDSHYFNVVYAGNIGVMQNVDILIEAAKLMKEKKDIWFHIIGDGVYRDKLEKRAKEYHITSISFWPMQSSKLAPAIYRAADVNVIPLVKDIYRTALPSKTATCMACGKPIIFAIGQESKFGKKVEQEAGCKVVESNDAEKIANEIMRIRTGRENEENALCFFKKHMSNKTNSYKYARIITKKG